MAEKRLESLHVKSDIAANNGATLSTFVEVLPGSKITRGLDGTERAVWKVDPTDAAWSFVQIGRVIEIAWTNGDWDEWRIYEYETNRRANGNLVGTITTLGIRYDLRHRAGASERIEADGFGDLDWEVPNLTPAQAITEVLGFRNVPGHFVQGTVSSTITQTLSADGETPLDTLMELATLANATTDGPVELGVTRTGTSAYTLSLVKQGSTAPKVFVHGLRNLKVLKHRASAITSRDINTQRVEGQVTRVFPFGGGPLGSRFTIGDNLWDVAAATTSTIDLSPDVGGNAIAFDDQFGGSTALTNRYVESATGGLYQITDSAVTNQRLTIGAHGISSTESIRIVAGSSGADLTFLDHPTGTATYGEWVGFADRRDIPNVNNILSLDQTFLSGTYTAGLAAGYAKVGTPTVSQENTVVKSGTKSQKVQSANGEGVETTVVKVSPDAKNVNIHAQFQVRIESLGASTGFLKAQLIDVGSSAKYPNDTTDEAVLSLTDQWIRLDIVVGPPFADFSNTSQVKLRLTTVGTSGTWYWDAAQADVTYRATPAQGFVAGRAANLLLHIGNALLSDANAPFDLIEVNLHDLYRLDGTAYPRDELVVGGDAIIVDEDSGIDITARVVELVEDPLVPADTTVKISRKQSDIRGLLGNRTRRALQGAGVDQGLARAFIAAGFHGTLDDVPDGVTFKRIIGVSTGNQTGTSSYQDTSITAGKLSISQLSAISDDAGIIVDGELRNAAGTRYIDLSASGSTTPWIKAESFKLLVNGDAEFGGLVSSSRFIAAQSRFGSTLNNVIIKPNALTGNPNVLFNATTVGTTTGAVQVGSIIARAPTTAGPGSLDVVSNSSAGLRLTVATNAELRITGYAGDFRINDSASTVYPTYGLSGVNVSTAAPTTSDDMPDGTIWVRV